MEAIHLAENTAIFPDSHTLNLGGRLLALNPPRIMAILNATPDSFYEGSRMHRSLPNLVEKARQAHRDGAAILDIGGMSTRPGAHEIPEKEELERVLPAVKAVKDALPDARISVDTYRASVAHACLEAGAHMINDVSGGAFDPGMFEVIAAHRVPYVLMHTPGKPEEMQEMTNYDQPIEDVVFHYFTHKLAPLRALGLNDIILDPGFGFGKTIEQNYRLLKNMHQFKALNLPYLAGISRKGMIWKPLNAQPETALAGTLAAQVLALMQGASILRVHDVAEASQALTIVQLYQNA